jgi:uncharacterized membrane protein YagU involved in acid resistance
MNKINKSRDSIYLTILWVGFLVGFLDITAALINYYSTTHKDPTRVFLFIASGVFGKAAYTNGSAMIVAGIIFHFLVAYIFTILFFLLFPRLKFMRWSKFLTGVCYGILIWTTMNFVVLPLSHTPKLPFQLKPALTGVSILIVAIGLPLSFLANAYYRRRTV